MIRVCTTVLLAGLLALAACKQSTDIGSPCNMTKPCTAGSPGCTNGTASLTEADVPSPLLDYVALGSTACDDLVCLRSGNPDKAAIVPGCTVDSDCPTGPGLYNLVCVNGYCSRYADTCPGGATNCTPTQLDAVGYCTSCCITDQDCANDYLGRTGMVCSQLLFDPAFLAALQQNSPDVYNEVFGSDACTRYCIDPRSLQSSQ